MANGMRVIAVRKSAFFWVRVIVKVVSSTFADGRDQRLVGVPAEDGDVVVVEALEGSGRFFQRRTL